MQYVKITQEEALKINGSFGIVDVRSNGKREKVYICSNETFIKNWGILNYRDQEFIEV